MAGEFPRKRRRTIPFPMRDLPQTRIFTMTVPPQERTFTIVVEVVAPPELAELVKVRVLRVKT